MRRTHLYDGPFQMSQRRLSIENYLYKTDASVIRTLLLVPRGVRFKRFYCTLIMRKRQCWKNRESRPFFYFAKVREEWTNMLLVQFMVIVDYTQSCMVASNLYKTSISCCNFTIIMYFFDITILNGDEYRSLTLLWFM